MLPNDIARCAGTDCPSAKYCRRFTDKATGNHTLFAAFWARRAPDQVACDSIIPLYNPLAEGETA